MPGTYQYDVEIKSNVAKLLSDMKQVQDRLDTVEGKEYKIKLNVDEKKLSNVISNLEKMLDSLGKGTGDFKQFENLSKELSSVVSEVQNLSKAFGKVDDSGTKTLLSSIQNIDKSLSELSQNILNVNKNMSNMGGNTSGAVKQVENITNAYQDAAKEAEKLVDAQSKIEQKTNISSGSNPAIEQQNKLQEELKETQTEIVETRSKYQSLLDVAKKQLDDDKGTNYYSGKTTEAKAFDNFTFNEQAKRSSHFDVWSKDYEELCSLMDKTEEELKSGSIGFDDAIDRMVSAYQKYDTATKIDVGGFDFLDGVENVPSVLSDTEKAVLNENKAIKESEYTLQDYINTYLELKKVKESSLSVDPKITAVTSNGRPIIKDGSDESFKAELMMKDMESKVLQIYGKDLSALADEHIKASESAKEHAKAENQVTQAIKESSSTASQDQRKDAFQGNSIDNSKEQLAIDKQLTKELESQAKAQQKKWKSFQKENEIYQKKQSEVEAVKRNKDAYEELANAIKQYSEVSKRVSGGKAEDGDIEKMTQLEEKISQLQKQPILSDSQVAKSESALVSLYDQLDKIEKKLQETNQKQVDSGFSKLSTYQGKVDKYQATINRFNDGGWTSSAYLENVQAVKNAVKEYETLLNELKGKDASLVTSDDINRLDNYEKKIKDTIATVTNMSAAEKGYNFVSAQKELDKIHKLLAENSKMSSEAKAKIRAYYAEIESGNPSMSLDKIHGKILKIYNAEVEAGRAGRTLWDTLKNSGFHQIAAQMAGMIGVYDVVNLGKEGFNVVRELNTALTEMRKVSDETVQSLKDYQATTFDTADAVGTTAKQIQNSTADWMRLGESMNQAAESAKDANVLLNVSEFEGIDEATESLVSMSQAYKDLDKMDIIDVLNNIGNNYSISTDGLATALKDSASALVTANNDLNEAVSLTTAGNAITQDPSKVGAGLRTISLRLVGTEEAKQELSDLGEETDGMITTVSKLRDTIMNATKAASSDGKGFDILDSNGNYKSTYEIMQGLADLYDNIVKKDKELGTNNLNLLLETIAGKNRSNIAASILQNGDMLRSVYEDAQNSDGSAEQELNSYLDSIDGKMAQLENRAQEFWFKVIDSETIKNGIDLLSTLLKGATNFVDTVGLLPTILAPVVAILGKGKSIQRFCPIW